MLKYAFLQVVAHCLNSVIISFSVMYLCLASMNKMLMVVKLLHFNIISPMMLSETVQFATLTLSIS